MVEVVCVCGLGSGECVLLMCVCGSSVCLVHTFVCGHSVCLVRIVCWCVWLVMCVWFWYFVSVMVLHFI